jgi:hypothetical protein
LTRRQNLTDTLLIFEDAGSSKTVFLPIKHLAYWTISRTGTVALWPVNGEPLHPSNSAEILLQLEALNPAPVPVPIPEVITLPKGTGAVTLREEAKPRAKKA